MDIRFSTLFTFILASSMLGVPAIAQDSGLPATYAQQRAAQQALENYREQVNENVLFLMGGQPGATYMSLTNDIATVVNDGLRMRVLPVVGNAGAQNVSDVLFLRGIDLGLTMVQVINYLKQTKQYGSNLDKQLVYIAPLTNDEMHVVARRGINSIFDLKGQKVNFNTAGSATAMLSGSIFKDLKIDVQPVYMSQSDAYERMRNGDVAATICICSKPVDIFAGTKSDSGFKLLDVPFVGALQDEYLPASLIPDDYPNLLAKGEKVETIATTTILFSFNWPRGTPRYNRTAKFVDAFFSKFADFQRPPRHPGWKSVNLAGTVPGLQRFAPAQEWLDRNQQLASQRATASKILPAGPAKPDATSVDTDALFRDFMDFTRRTRK